jgi:hypothetical protein
MALLAELCPSETTIDPAGFCTNVLMADGVSPNTVVDHVE